MKSTLLFILSVLIFTGCSNSDTVKISGTYNGKVNKILYLSQVDIDTPVLINSIRIKKSGKFNISFKADQIKYYNLGFNSTEFITLIASPGDRIKVIFKNKSLHKGYEIYGSPESEKVRDLDARLSETYVRLDSLETIYRDKLESPGFDTTGPALEEIYMKLINDQRMSNISFILDNLASFSSIKALYQRLDDGTYVLYKDNDLQYFKLVSDTLNKYYPDSKQVKALSSNLEKELNEMYMTRLSAMAENLEPVSLEIELPDQNGKMVKLSSFKGKNYVLLTFWSIQSNECIANNLQMKEYYKMYHRKGLEIFQVNLDENEEGWKSVVRFDELPWISVRDYQDGSSSVARLYNVTSVPTNYLINREGEIVGKNLYGKPLQIKLSQIFD